MRKRYLQTILAAAAGVLLLAIVAFGQGAVDGDWHTVDGGGGVSQGVTFTVRGTAGQSADDGDWHTVDGGGGVSQGSTFTVRGTAGQPDAGSAVGVTYTVHGGFWGVAIAKHDVYLPVIVRQG